MSPVTPWDGIPGFDWPVRQRSAGGQPPPCNPLVRRCAVCQACFLHLAAGHTGERGLWSSRAMVWYCSQECYDAAGELP